MHDGVDQSRVARIRVREPRQLHRLLRWPIVEDFDISVVVNLLTKM